MRSLNSTEGEEVSKMDTPILKNKRNCLIYHKLKKGIQNGHPLNRFFNRSLKNLELKVSKMDTQWSS